MGKHKKHKKEKKVKKHHKRKYSSGSSASSSEEEWVEKRTKNKEYVSSEEEYMPKSCGSSDVYKIKNKDNKSPEDAVATMNADRNRDEWMSLPTLFTSSSNIDRRKAKEEKNKSEREKQQYNPRECARELNPYWKDGGDGLPKFKKPVDDDNKDSYDKYRSSSTFPPKTSGWRKKKEEPRDHKNKESKGKYIKEEKHNINDSREESISKNTQGKILERNPNDALKIEEQHENEAVLSEKELNALAAKVVKAEIMGNTKLANELKEKLERSRMARQITPKVEEVLLVHTDAQGRSQPLKQKSEYGEYSGASKKKKTKTETHQDGQRVRYFADDDKYSLREMFENEKFNTVEDSNRDFIKSSSKIRKNDDLDDIFSDNIRKKESDEKTDSRNRDRAIAEHKKMSKSLDSCSFCIQSESMQKHLMVSMVETAYLSLPSFEPLTDGHCLIVPVRHIPCATQLDENEWSDIMNIRKALVKMFKDKNMDVIFFEVAKNFYKYPHMVIECIPLPVEHGDLAPIYFKKAIDESETEWAMNKKLVSLADRDVRKAVPKGLPYFAVSFGMQEGYAHVIEDEKMFPANFAQEIIGGMMDLDHGKWRKPKKQKFDDQSRRVMQFSKEWANYDCTVK